MDELDFYHTKLAIEQRAEEIEKYKNMVFELAKMIEERMGIKHLFPKDYLAMTYQSYLRNGKTPEDAYTKTAMQICSDWKSIGRKIDE